MVHKVSFPQIDSELGEEHSHQISQSEADQFYTFGLLCGFPCLTCEHQVFFHSRTQYQHTVCSWSVSVCVCVLAATFLSPRPVCSILSRWAHLLLKITEIISGRRRLKMTTHLSIRTGFLEHSESKKSSGSVKPVLSGSEWGAASSVNLWPLQTLQVMYIDFPFSLSYRLVRVVSCCVHVLPDHHTFVCASPLLLAEQCCEVVRVRFAPPQHTTQSNVHYFKRRVEVMAELRVRHMTSTWETRAQVTSFIHVKFVT